jgi:glycosyltransferase involved in cell wall biosynthesis
MKSVCMLVQNHYEMDIRVRRKAEALIAAGYSVDVLALASEKATARNFTLNGVNVYTVSLGKKRGSLVRYAFEYLAFLWWSFWKLSAMMGKRRYAIVDVNTLPDFLVFAGAYARLRGAKIIFDMHEITPEFYMSKYGMKESSLLVGLLKLVEKISFKFADYVLTINEPIQKLLEGRGLRASKATVIMNAVDESLFARAASAGAPAAAEAARPKFLMMYHGTLTHIYGVDIAIEAFGQAHQEMPGAEFWILGNGPEKASLENRVKELGLEAKVKFKGNVLPDEIPLWLKRCDIGVLATRQDVFLDYSFSNKLSEYIVMDKAVIASRLKAIRHYFSEDALTYFEPNHPAGLAKQMTRLYRDPELRARLAVTARQEYSPISWEVMKQRYLKLAADIVGMKPEPSRQAQTGAASVGARPVDAINR